MSRAIISSILKWRPTNSIFYFASQHKMLQRVNISLVLVKSNLEVGKCGSTRAVDQAGHWLVPARYCGWANT